MMCRSLRDSGGDRRWSRGVGRCVSRCVSRCVGHYAGRYVFAKISICFWVTAGAGESSFILQYTQFLRHASRLFLPVSSSDTFVHCAVLGGRRTWRVNAFTNSVAHLGCLSHFHRPLSHCCSVRALKIISPLQQPEKIKEIKEMEAIYQNQWKFRSRLY